METENLIIISLTTVPERLENENEDGLKLVLSSLCEQDDKHYEVHFNVPYVSKVTNKKYVIPNWISDYEKKYNHLKVFRTEDFGPPTKFVPTVKRVEDGETILVIVDDDLIYHNELVSEHRKYQNILKDSVIGYDGRGCEIPLYNFDLRDSWILCVTKIRETHFLQHYKSVSYKVKLFTDDFFNNYFGKTMSDDVLVSTYFRNNQIKMYVVPYEKENHLFETKELWDVNQGVTSFPILRYASSVENTGCKNPEMLKVELPFYDPFTSIPTKSNLIFTPSKFKTDKINHGYLQVYHKLFEENNFFKKIVEIGVHMGDSLELLFSYFKDAIIYGVDINDCSKLNNEKIKTLIFNQENREDLNKLLEIVGHDVDMIIDDGGHTMKQQQISFGCLFKAIKDGGIYIIEDLHTSNWTDRGYITSEDLITSLEMLNTFNQTGKIMSNHITEDEKKYLEDTIESITIWSRTKDFNESVTSIIKKK